MYGEIQKNKLKSLFLLLGFIFFSFILILLFNFIIGNNIYQSILIGIGSFFSTSIISLLLYFFGDKIVLYTTRAIDVTGNPDYKEINDLVEILAIKANLPKPKVYILPDESLNAFATGRNPEKAHVALTEGIIKSLDKEELSGVIAHELAHIKNYDIRLMLIVSVIAGTISGISDYFLRSFLNRNNENNSISTILTVGIGFVVYIISIIVIKLVELAISRRREYLADATAVEITRNPQAFIRALYKIGNSDIPTENANDGNAYMFFSNPFKNKNWLHIFSTHPPIEKRIEAIQRMIT